MLFLISTQILCSHPIMNLLKSSPPPPPLPIVGGALDRCEDGGGESRLPEEIAAAWVHSAAAAVLPVEVCC